MSIFAELKRRKVVQVAAVYAVVAWLSIQIITAIEDPLSLPDWMDTVVIVLLAIGFPIALILSWAFDVTPEGIKTADKVDTNTAPAQVPATRFTNVVQGLVLLAVGFLVVDQYFLDGPQSNNGPIVRSDDGAPVVTRFEYHFDADETFVGSHSRLAISPDSRFFAYIVSGGIHVRTMNDIEPRQVVKNGEANSIVISPNEQAIAYWNAATLQLNRIAINGGAPAVIASDVDEPHGLSWASDGSIIFALDDGIYRVSGDGSAAPDRIISISEELHAYGPQLLPDGDTVLFSVATPGDWDNGDIVTESISAQERTVLVNGGTAARYLTSGHLVYALGNQLYATAFDLNSLNVVGESILVADAVVRHSNVWETGAASFDVSDNGTLVYLTGNVDRKLALTWIDRNGQETAIPLEPGDFSSPRISPQGDRAVLDMRGPGNPMITWNFANEQLTRLNLGTNGGDTPIWSPDGEHITYHPGTDALIDERTSNNAGDPERLVTGGTDALDPYHPGAYSPDGEAIIISGRSGLDSSWDLGMIDLAGNAEPRWLLRAAAREDNPVFSPDGQWLVYQSNESGRDEIYARPYPNVDEGRVQVSSRGGTAPRWSKRPGELFYLEPGDPPRLIAVKASTSEAEFSVENQKILFDWIYSTNFDKGYDVTADGQRFLALKPMTANDVVPRIVVVNNWFEELQQLLPTK
jgi:serine/threonine-protein kinase